MPGRYSGGDKFRFGSQKQQKDDEIYGVGNEYAFKYRMEDARLNRFWSVDPLAAKYPYYSQYAFSGNRLTDMTELETNKYRYMGLRRHVMSFVGSAFKFIFCNKKHKSFKEIHLEGALGDNLWSDYSSNNATLGTIIVVILFLIYLAIEHFLGFS